MDPDWKYGIEPELKSAGFINILICKVFPFESIWIMPP